MKKNVKIISWAVRLVAAIILLQTLYFKFTAHEESVYIFETLGMEPAGRIGSGIAELIAGILLIIPMTAGIGGALGLGVISGAIFFHLTSLGIEINGDPTLFYLAVIVFVCCLMTVILHRREIPFIKAWFK